MQIRMKLNTAATATVDRWPSVRTLALVKINDVDINHIVLMNCTCYVLAYEVCLVFVSNANPCYVWNVNQLRT
jgi:hypothetical protein